MDEPLEAVAYVARSPNRIRVLEALGEGPHTRRELGDLTGASRSTISRTLSDLEDHRWIERSGDHYLATPLGRLVSEGISPLVETMETVEALHDVAHLLPADADIDLRAFVDATIATPDSVDPTAHMDRGFEHIATADRFEILANTAIPRFIAEAVTRLRHEDFSFTAVVPAEFVRELAPDSTILTGLGDIVDSGGAVRLVNGEIDHNVAVADDVVVLWLCDDAGTHQGLLVTENRRVREWATALIDRHDAHATPLQEGAVAPGDG